MLEFIPSDYHQQFRTILRQSTAQNGRKRDATITRENTGEEEWLQNLMDNEYGKLRRSKECKMEESIGDSDELLIKKESERALEKEQDQNNAPARIGRANDGKRGEIVKVKREKENACPLTVGPSSSSSAPPGLQKNRQLMQDFIHQVKSVPATDSLADNLDAYDVPLSLGIVATVKFMNIRTCIARVPNITPPHVYAPASEGEKCAK